MRKQKKLILILLAVLALLTVVYFAVVRPLTEKGAGTKLDPVPLLEGEAYFSMNGLTSTQIPVAFPQYGRSDICEVRIANGKSDYLFYNYISDASKQRRSYFMLGKYNKDGKIDFYNPTIAEQFENFDYTSLYDNTSKIPTMLAAVGAITFKDRVYIRADAEATAGAKITDAEYQRILHKYGLADEDTPAYIELVRYALDANGNYLYSHDESHRVICMRVTEDATLYYYADTVTYTEAEGYNYDNAEPYTGALNVIRPMADTSKPATRVYVGDMTPDDSGYYFYVEGRDVIYITGTTSIGDVVYKDLSFYVQPRLVTKADSDYTSYMPVSFRYWKKIGRLDLGGIGPKDSVIFSYKSLIKDGVGSAAGGGIFSLMTDSVDARIRAALLSSGANIGSVMTLTDLNEFPRMTPVALGKSEIYSFYAVTGIVKDREIETTGGTAVSDRDIVLVVYRIGNSEPMIGAIDLGTEGLPQAIKDALVGKTVADAGAPLPNAPISTANVTFDESTVTRVYTCTYKITSIGGLATKEDLSDLKIDKDAYVPSSGYALIHYEVEIMGARYSESAVIPMAGTEMDLIGHFREAIRGKKVGPHTDLTVSVDFPYDPILSYTIYEDLKIEDVVSFDEELSFSFINISERDPYTGNSLYVITGPIPRTVYTLDPESCQSVLFNFSDLLGSETVAVGLDHEVIERFGLDAHALYFELPFELYEKSVNENNKIDYGHNYSIGYYLYISAPDENGVRYIGSTMYDIVVKYEGTAFDFLDWDFLTGWTNRFIMGIPVENLKEITVDIGYSDLRETHSFVISHDPRYYLYSDSEPMSRVYVSYVAGGEIRYQTERVSKDLVVTDNREVKGDSKYYTQPGMQVTPIPGKSYYNVWTVMNGENLDARYQRQNNWTDEEVRKNRVDMDFAGVNNLKAALGVLYTTIYAGKIEGELTDAEREAVLADTSNRVFEIRMLLAPDARYSAGRRISLSFWTYSSGRCLVRLEDKTNGIVSTEFFVYASEVKNIVSAFRLVAAGKTVDVTNSYLPKFE